MGVPPWLGSCRLSWTSIFHIHLSSLWPSTATVVGSVSASCSYPSLWKNSSAQCAHHPFSRSWHGTSSLTVALKWCRNDSLLPNFKTFKKESIVDGQDAHRSMTLRPNEAAAILDFVCGQAREFLGWLSFAVSVEGFVDGSYGYWRIVPKRPHTGQPSQLTMNDTPCQPCLVETRLPPLCILITSYKNVLRPHNQVDATTGGFVRKYDSLNPLVDLFLHNNCNFCGYTPFSDTPKYLYQIVDDISQQLGLISL